MPKTKKAPTPFSVTLFFKSEKALEEFMGQLTDGWGENEVMVDENNVVSVWCVRCEGGGCDECQEGEVI